MPPFSPIERRALWRHVGIFDEELRAIYLQSGGDPAQFSTARDFFMTEVVIGEGAVSVRGTPTRPQLLFAQLFAGTAMSMRLIEQMFAEHLEGRLDRQWDGVLVGYGMAEMEHQTIGAQIAPLIRGGHLSTTNLTRVQDIVRRYTGPVTLVEQGRTRQVVVQKGAEVLVGGLLEGWSAKFRSETIKPIATAARSMRGEDCQRELVNYPARLRLHRHPLLFLRYASQFYGDLFPATRLVFDCPATVPQVTSPDAIAVMKIVASALRIAAAAGDRHRPNTIEFAWTGNDLRIAESSGALQRRFALHTEFQTTRASWVERGAILSPALVIPMSVVPGVVAVAAL